MVEKTLAQLGNIKIQVPDNVTINEGPEGATLEGEGFPTISITHELGEFNGTGIGRSSGMGKVEAEITIPTAKWTCKTDKAGKHEDLVVEICESITAPLNPNIAGLECETVEGFDAAAVRAAWTGMAEALLACNERFGDIGASFGFTLSVQAKSHSFSSYNNQPNADEAKACMDDIYKELRATEAFNHEELEAGKISCGGQYSPY